MASTDVRFDRKEFYERVYDIVRAVPVGRVTTYGAIANCLGAKGSARMVGYALHGAATMAGIPAHRVVNRAGLLTGAPAFGGNEVMANFLRAEGVRVEDNRVLDFKTLFWNPAGQLLDSF